MTVPNHIQEKIRDHALRYIADEYSIDPNSLNIHVYHEPIGSDEDILLFGGRKQKSGLDADAFLVLADVNPLHNWGHPVKHLYYYAESGEFSHSTNEIFPHIEYFTNPESHVPLHTPMRHSRNKTVGDNAAPAPPAPQVESNSEFAGRHYALLFSGCSNKRHVDDLEFLYRTLIDKYSFDPKNITVLNHDGSLNYYSQVPWNNPENETADTVTDVGNWPGDNTPYRMKVNGPGTKEALQKALADIVAPLGPDDFLLLHTNNHGGGTPDGWNEDFLCCYPLGDPYYPEDYAADLKKLPSFKTFVVMMEQCYSGAFAQPTIDNSPAKQTVFTSPVTGLQSSCGGPDYDPFAENWISALASHTPSGNAVSANGNSLKDAFDYASQLANCSVEGGGKTTPVYKDAPDGIGSKITLFG